MLAVAAFTLTFAARPASADWPSLGRAIATAAGSQDRPRAVSDGASGAIIVWQDSRSSRVNVFASRVLSTGELDPAWPVDGRALLTDSTALASASGGQQLPVVASDGEGGAIVAWQDGRSVATGLDIYAQHVLASGEADPAWPANGRALCIAPGQQNIPAIVSDGAGGAIVTWMDDRSSVTGADIYAQHVLASGAVDPAWPVNGAALATAPALQASPGIVSDGSGGAIVTWHDFRSSATSADIYAQRVTGAGVVDPAWPADGRALSLAAGTQSNPAIVTDGDHGAIVSWEDTRDVLSHIYAQRVLGSGTIAPGWPADGLAVCTAPVDQVQAKIATDHAGGAIVTWLDARNGTNHNPYVQHVLASGVTDPAWLVNGRALSLSDGEEATASIVGDGLGGAIVSWEEDSFVFANHVEASGALDPTFPVNGRFMRLLLTFQRDPDLAPAGAGGAIVAWADRASGRESDVYGALVATEATLAVEPGGSAPRVAFSPPSPNPASSAVTLRFSLPRSTRVSLSIFDAGGRRIRALASGVQPEGEHAIAWDLRDESGAPAGAGIYFARLEVEGQVLTRRLARLN